jgi:hypothetical protein
MESIRRIVYMCEVCLRSSEVAEVCHGRTMIECDAGCEGDDCTKPVVDQDGHLMSHAPKWWVFRHRRIAAHTARYATNDA